jgi:hypothetical protein
MLPTRTVDDATGTIIESPVECTTAGLVAALTIPLGTRKRLVSVFSILMLLYGDGSLRLLLDAKAHIVTGASI